MRYGLFSTPGMITDEEPDFIPGSEEGFRLSPGESFRAEQGRDLIVEPSPVSGPINFLASPLMEVDGKPVGSDRVPVSALPKSAGIRVRSRCRAAQW
jgi:hypothetical protein